MHQRAMDIRPFSEADTEAVVALWQACGLTRPWNNPYRDIARKQQVQPELFLVADIEGRVAGTAMAGWEGHRGWLNYLAVAPDQRGRGVGRQLVHTIEQRLQAMGCPKLSLQVRSSNAEVLRFYRALGYTVDDVVSLGKRLIHDAPPGHP